MEANVSYAKKCWLPILLLTLSIGLNAQSDAKQGKTDSPQPDWIVKVFQVKYADVNQLARVFTAFGVPVQPSVPNKAIAVRGPKEIVNAIEESIKRLDVPPPPVKNLEFTVYLLESSAQPNGKLPQALQPVIKQLKASFPNYQGYQLLETLVTRNREGGGSEVSGTLPPVIKDVPAESTYQFRIHDATVSPDDKSGTIRINGLRLALRIPVRTGGGGPGTTWAYRDVGITTDIDVREGQQVVVGKANMVNSDDALFLVLTVKIAE